MIHTWAYLSLNALLLAFLFAVIYQSAIKGARLHFHLGLAFLLVFLMEFEVYREVSRLVGLPVHVSDLRIRYVCALHFLIGLFVREVILHAESKD